MPGPVDYDSLMSGGAGDGSGAPAPLGDAQAENPYDKIMAASKGAAKTALAGASDANPDQAGQAIGVGTALGVPPAAVETDVPGYTAALQAKKNAAIVDGNPAISDWLAANPEAARIAKDDLDKLDGVSKAWAALSSGWSESFLSNERGRLGNRAQLGEDVSGQVAGIDQAIAAKPELSGLYGKLQGVAGFAGGMLDNFMRGAPELAAGAGLGAAIGSTAGGVGAAPGAVVGGAIGFGLGWKWDMSRVAAGQAYLDLGKVQGRNGEAIDETVRQAGAVLVGLGTFALGSLGGKVAESFVGDAVKQAIVQPTIARAIGQFGQRLAGAGLEGAALNTAMQGASIVGDEFARQFSPGDFATLTNDPVRRQQVLDQLMSAALDGAMLFPLMRLPGASAGLVGDTLRARQATADAGALQSVVDGAADSKTRGRSLGAFYDFLSRQAQGSPVENLYVDAGKVRDLYQSLGVEPGREDGVLGPVAGDIKEQLDRAQATGGDVELPSAAFVTHLAGSDVANQLMPDVRVRPDAWTLREAQDYDGRRAQLIADNAAGLREQLEHDYSAEEPTQAVYGDMFSKLRAAGQTVDASRQYAAVIAARYETRAERLGGDDTAADLYGREGVDVKRVLPASLEHVPVDDSDMVINALRNGSKLPSDRDLFGPSLIEHLKERGSGAGIYDANHNLTGYHGGLVDAGGELAHMDAQKTRGLVLAGGARDQAIAEHRNDLDAAAHHAWEMGYFPEHQERPEPNDLLDAMRDELSGNKHYAALDVDERRAGFKSAVGDLDRFLNERGLDAKDLTNAQIKQKLRDYQSEGLGTGRDFTQEARGKITLDNGKALITLFRDADLSTFLHESGHLFLDELVRDASGEDAPEGLRADLAATLKWLHVKSAEEIGTEQHEQWARAFEAYALEGRAPSVALAGAFAKFKAWLTRIYGSIVALKTPISDEVRGVMDRLLASDHEIAAARNRESLNPIFPDAASAGMTVAEFKAYTDGVAKARASAEERLLKRSMAEVRARRTAEWKDEAAAMRGEVESEMRSRLDLKAQYKLRTGRLLDDPTAEPAPIFKLSRADMAEMYGNDEAPALLPKGTYANKGGAHPDEAAELMGYPSGDGLVKGLMGLEATRRSAEEITGKKLDGAKYLSYLIDQEVEARMRERHGDALADGSIEEEALAAVHNAAQADVMAMELRALANRAGAEAPLTIDDLRNWVQGEIADMKVTRGADQRVFARAEAKAGKEVERALLKGDVATAFGAKQRQLVNHLLAIEAGLAADDLDKGKALFARMASGAKFDGIDQAYTDQIHGLLSRFGYEPKRDADELKRGLGGTSLETFVANRYAEGREPVVASALFDPSLAKSVDDLTVDQFRALKDAVESLRQLGRDEQTVTLDGRRVDRELAVNEIVARLDAMRQRGVSDWYAPERRPGLEGLRTRVLSRLRTMDAALLKQEQVFDWVDGGDAQGPMNRYIFSRLKDGQHFEDDRRGQVAERFRQVAEANGKEWAKGLDREVLDKSLVGPDFNKVSRKNMLAIALNTGTESNFDRLAKGYGWNRDDVMGWLHRNMSAQDWHFVQGMWDTFETLRPEIDDLQRRATGVGIAFVPSRPFDTPHGQMRGGYYPLVYDAARSIEADRHAGRAAGEALFENQYLRATTPKGHTIARVDDLKRPVSLDLDLIPWKIGQTIHDLAFREAVIDADKLLSDKRVMRAMDAALGPEYTANLRPWLQSIANSRNVNDPALTMINKGLRWIRSNATMVGIGFRITTMFKHGSTALANSFGELGINGMRRGMQEFIGTPQQMARTWKWVTSESAEMRNRMDHYDRDVRDNLKTLLGERGLKADAQRYGHYGVAFLDMMSAIPTWIGALRKAEGEGLGHDEAVAYADKLVRKAHGAQGLVDLPSIQRGDEMKKLLTMFYGFFNHVYNRQRDTLHTAAGIPDKLRGNDYAGARRDFAMVLARSFYYVAVPALVEQLYTEGGPDEENGEGWISWALKAIAWELPAGLPVVRDIANAVKHGGDYAFSPIQQAVTTALQTGKDIAHATGLADGEVSSRWLQHAIETAGYITGWPSGQAAGTAQYLWDIGTGVHDPENAMQFLRGLMYGPSAEKAQ